MRILVTGSDGFIGRHLCKELRDRGHFVLSADISYSDARKLDCRQEAAVWHTIAERKPDLVVHLAAKVGRLFGEDNIQRTISDNAWMTANVAHACGELGVRLAYASTSEVYGDRGDHLCVEDEPFAGVPHNIYGLSKRWGEEACQLYAPDRLTILRFSMPYGPGLPAGRGRAALINFLYNALHRQPITVHQGSERSWCYIEDTCRAAALALEHPAGGVYNVGRDDNAQPMARVAEMACDLVAAPHALIQQVPAPNRQTVVKRLGTDKIRLLGWKPTVDLDEGMLRTLGWVRTLPRPEREQVAA